jgi:hypothetical protein
VDFCFGVSGRAVVVVVLLEKEVVEGVSFKGDV